MTTVEKVLARYPDANARHYADLNGWYVIHRRGAYSLEREGWLGQGATEQLAWDSAANNLP